MILLYAIAISDVHLGHDENCDREAFMSFLKELEEPNRNIEGLGSSDSIKHLVLMGDIIDFWRGLNERILLDNIDVLQRINGLA